MFDYKYYYIRFLQYLVYIYNFFSKKLNKIQKIPLKWNERILLIKLDRIWDAVWGVNQTKILKKNFPNIKIDVLCNNYNKFVFEESKNLFNKIIIINTTPPSYLAKNIYKPFKIIYDTIQPITKNFRKIKNLRWKYNLIIDTTSRKGIFIRKYIWWKIITPIWHKEIWNYKIRWWIFENLNINFNLKIWNNYQNLNNKKILLFIWWKEPNKIDLETNLKIAKEFEKHWFEVDILTDKRIHLEKIENKIYKLNLKNNFFVENKLFRDFLKNYSLFVWPDWWVFHYASQFIPWFGIYTATNLFAIDKVKFLKKIWNWKIYKSQIKNNIYITQDLKCVWCFQIWCLLKNCWKLLDNEIQIIIKEIVKFMLKI